MFAAPIADRLGELFSEFLAHRLRFPRVYRLPFHTVRRFAAAVLVKAVRVERKCYRYFCGVSSRADDEVRSGRNRGNGRLLT